MTKSKMSLLIAFLVVSPLRAQQAAHDTAQTAGPPAYSPQPTDAIDPLGLPVLPAPGSPDHPLSLDEVVALSLRYSPALAQAQPDVAMAAARIGKAVATGMPAVSGSLFAGDSRRGAIIPGPDGIAPVSLMSLPPGAFLDEDITAMLPIYTGGQVDAEKRAAVAARDASLDDVETVRQDAALQTRIAYRKVLYDRDVLQAREQDLTAAEEGLRVDSDRFEAGKLAEVTLFRDRSLVATAQQNETNARRDYGLAFAGLEQVMGVSTQSRLVLAEPPAMPETPPAGPATALPAAPPPTTTVAVPPLESPGLLAGDQAEFAGLLAKALAGRPEAHAAAMRIRQAGFDVDRAESGFRPRVNVMGMQGASRGQNGLNFTIGVVASLPIFEGGALNAARKESRAEVEKAMAEERSVRVQIEQDVRSAWLNRAAARENLVASLTALDQARQTYDIQQLRFATGKGIQLEVLDALAALTNSRTDLARARFESAVAEDQLLRAAGEILVVEKP